MNVPKGCKKIAENENIVVYEYDGWYYLRGFGNADIIFTSRQEWNLFSTTIRMADLVINGEEE